MMDTHKISIRVVIDYRTIRHSSSLSGHNQIQLDTRNESPIRTIQTKKTDSLKVKQCDIEQYKKRVEWTLH